LLEGNQALPIKGMQQSESNLIIDPESLNTIYEKYLVLLQEDATAKISEVLKYEPYST
jgi:hypothetical protein